MAADYNQQVGIKSYLKRKFGTNPTELKRLADIAYAEATETVTLTSLAAEGGSQAGQITCPKGMLLLILEELIAENDPTAPRGSSVGFLSVR